MEHYKEEDLKFTDEEQKLVLAWIAAHREKPVGKSKIQHIPQLMTIPDEKGNLQRWAVCRCGKMLKLDGTR